MLLQRVGVPLFLLHSITLFKYTAVFFIHSFTSGHLGCFQHLAIVNCAAMNIGEHKFFELVFQDSEGIIPTLELMGQKAVPFLVF